MIKMILKYSIRGGCSGFQCSVLRTRFEVVPRQAARYTSTLDKPGNGDPQAPTSNAAGGSLHRSEVKTIFANSSLRNNTSQDGQTSGHPSPIHSTTGKTLPATAPCHAQPSTKQYKSKCIPASGPNINLLVHPHASALSFNLPSSLLLSSWNVDMDSFQGFFVHHDTTTRNR